MSRRRDHLLQGNMHLKLGEQEFNQHAPTQLTQHNGKQCRLDHAQAGAQQSYTWWKCPHQFTQLCGDVSSPAVTR